MVMVVMMLMLLCFEKGSCHVSSRDGLFDSLEDLYAGQIIPGSGDDLRMIVDFLDQGNSLIELVLSDIARTA